MTYIPAPTPPPSHDLTYPGAYTSWSDFITALHAKRSSLSPSLAVRVFIDADVTVPTGTWTVNNIGFSGVEFDAGSIVRYFHFEDGAQLLKPPTRWNNIFFDNNTNPSPAIVMNGLAMTIEGDQAPETAFGEGTPSEPQLYSGSAAIIHASGGANIIRFGGTVNVTGGGVPAIDASGSSSLIIEMNDRSRIDASMLDGNPSSGGVQVDLISPNAEFNYNQTSQFFAHLFERPFELAGFTPGGAPGESSELKLEPGDAYFLLAPYENPNVALTLRLVVTVSDHTHSKQRTFEQTFTIRLFANIPSVVEAGDQLSIGEADPSFSLTVAAVGGPNRIAVTFNTGTTTSFCLVEAKAYVSSVSF